VRSSPRVPIAINPVEAAEIDARLAAVDAGSHEHQCLLAKRLHPLIERRVPARCVEAAPGLRSARLRFADGTTVLVRGAVPGDLALLAAAMVRRSVPADACRSDGGCTRLLFGWPGGRRTLSILVTGLDQPD
jgi:hypothetical protein